jgi:carboxypeptidase D
MRLSLLNFWVAAASLALLRTANARQVTKAELRARQAKAAENWERAAARTRDHKPLQQQTRRGLTFSNPKAAEFLVDGTKIPDVDFDVGASYAGLLPISGNANETRKVCTLAVMFGF